MLVNSASMGTVSSYSYPPFVPLPPIEPFTPKPVSLSLEKQITFIKAIEKKAFQELGALKAFIGYVRTRGIAHLEHALIKPAGYFARLFSGESWREWQEHRTPLGRVIYRFLDYAQNSDRVESFMEQLGPEVLKEANRAAAAVFPSNVDLSSLDTYIDGTEALEMGEIGDIDGDGIGDFYMATTTSGYVIFGVKDFVRFLPSTLEHSRLKYLKITSNHTNYYYGLANPLSPLGDRNNDGIDDFIICWPFASPGGIKRAGSCNIVLGRKNWPIELKIAENGNEIVGNEPNGNFGFAVVREGSSVAISAPAFTGTGEPIPKVYVNTDPFKTKEGLILVGEADSGFGASMDIGNVGRKDGADIIVGAHYSDGQRAGKVYVVYDFADLGNRLLYVPTMPDSTGFILGGDSLFGFPVRFLGNIMGDTVGAFAVGSVKEGVYIAHRAAGITKSPADIKDIIEITKIDCPGIRNIGRVDINADGYTDIAIAQRYQTIIVLGHRGQWDRLIQPEALDGNNGFIAKGNPGSANSIGDVNNDGIQDLGIGANLFTSRSYVLLGRNIPLSGFYKKIIYGTIIGGGGAVLVSVALFIVVKKIRALRAQAYAPIPVAPPAPLPAPPPVAGDIELQAIIITGG